MNPYPILTMVCGHPPEDIRAAHGNYVRWFEQAMGSRVSLLPWHVQERGEDPKLQEYAGLLITGSPASLTAPEPWMENAIELIRQASELGVPALGVCFGHQLVGCAFGAPTVPAPDEGEHGTKEIFLAERGQADPLFANLPAHFCAQLSHDDQVDPDAVSHSNGLQILAHSEGCRVQALAAGPHIRSVQFHPEFTAAITQSYLDKREGEPAPQVCREATAILSNWIDHWIAGRAP